MKAQGGDAVHSKNLYEDQEEVGQTQAEPDPNVIMDHVQLARRAQRQPPTAATTRRKPKFEEQQRDQEDDVDVIDKPDPDNPPTGVSYS